MMWFWLALGSAVFAALTSILAKLGIEGVGSNLATAIRTMVVVVMAWGMVFLTNQQGGIRSIDQKSWIFLILSGLATGASWLCYYKALQLGDASKVVPIDKLSVVITIVLAFVFLHEKVTTRSVLGCILEEGLCVQIMHIGPYDDEPATVAVMDRYLQENGYENDLSDTRLHHEIYLSDTRKVEPAKRKTVIRHPIRKAL